MKVEIELHRDGESEIVEYDYALREPAEKPMILDVLLQAQATTLPDLAFRYGCRARNCGVCTVDINGRPRVACRARVREGDRISPVNTLPVLADIECYACLQNCPMHAKNFENGADASPPDGYQYGNPFSLLKLQLLRLDPLNTEAGREQALANAQELGLEMCRDCKGCKCGVGIDLMGKVVRPMLAAAGE